MYFNRGDGEPQRDRAGSGAEFAREMMSKAAEDLGNLKAKAGDFFSQFSS